MSTEDTVRGDYGLVPDPVNDNGPERRIWETTSVAPDPHKAGHFYVTQRLAGQYKKMPVLKPEYYLARTAQGKSGAELYELKVVWTPRESGEQPVTRVLYCTMDSQGRMVNVFKDASQGKSARGGAGE